MNEKQQRITTRFDFICPFCKKKGTVGVDDEKQPFVFHEMPQCEQFDKMSADGYVQLVVCQKTSN